jgi:hypothetical protein
MIQAEGAILLRSKLEIGAAMIQAKNGEGAILLRESTAVLAAVAGDGKRAVLVQAHGEFGDQIVVAHGGVGELLVLLDWSHHRTMNTFFQNL